MLVLKTGDFGTLSMLLGKGPKIKKRESMVFDHRGGGGGFTQNQIFIQNGYQYIEC